MKLNETIKERRLQRGMTQEQLAGCLGVSAPAVSKWEKGLTFPDITLLPILARVLETDLNTLLDFQAEPTPLYIQQMLEQISSIAKKDGIESAFQFARQLLATYPISYGMRLSFAMALDGILMMFAQSIDRSSYEKEIESYYTQCIESKEEVVANQAKYMLVAKYRNQNEFTKAQQLLETIVDRGTIDKQRLQASIYLQQHQLEDAAKIIEGKVLSEINALQMSCITLMEIAYDEKRDADAQVLAQKACEFAAIFDMWEYNQYLAPFRLSMMKKDAQGCMQAMHKMVLAIYQPWDISLSPLYHHTKQKKVDKVDHVMEQSFIENMILELENPQMSEYAFLREAKEYPEFMQWLKATCKKRKRT